MTNQINPRLSVKARSVVVAYRTYQILRTPLAYAMFLEKLAEYRRWKEGGLTR